MLIWVLVLRNPKIYTEQVAHLLLPPIRQELKHRPQAVFRTYVARKWKNMNAPTQARVVYRAALM